MFDVDTTDNMLYYFDHGDGYVKRASIDSTEAESLYTHIGLDVWSIAVDWIGRFVSTTLLSMTANIGI